MHYMCILCGYVYQETKDTSGGRILTGNFWSLADDWKCPECGTDKANFDLLTPAKNLDDQAEN